MNWLDGNREIDRHRDVLGRILALLLALAGLADRAAGLPARRRLHVLGILACGEAEARAFVIGLANAPAEGDAAMQDCASSGSAERLALSFRVLALVLGAMLARARRSESAAHASRHAVSPIPHRRPAHPPFRVLPAPDT